LVKVFLADKDDFQDLKSSVSNKEGAETAV
jgi:hypothetical protein